MLLQVRQNEYSVCTVVSGRAFKSTGGKRTLSTKGKRKKIVTHRTETKKTGKTKENVARLSVRVYSLRSLRAVTYCRSTRFHYTSMKGAGYSRGRYVYAADAETDTGTRKERHCRRVRTCMSVFIVLYLYGKRRLERLA